MIMMCPRFGSDRVSESYEGRAAGSLLEVWQARSPVQLLG